MHEARRSLVKKPGMVAYAYNCSMWEFEAGVSAMSSTPATLRRESLSQKYKERRGGGILSPLS